MQKRYEITISEHTQEKKIRGNEWERGVNKEDPEEYGYTPEIEKTVDVHREVFKQSVDDLDLPSVIKAINGL